MNAMDIATLLLTPGIGRKNTFKLLEQYGEADLTINYLKEIITNKFYEISSIELHNSCEKSKRIMDWAEKKHIKIVDFKSSRYPSSLKAIDDPPLLLFIKGDYEFIRKEENCIGVIGSRMPTDYGKEISKMVGRYLAKKNIGVISGLALGCDAGAHTGCLEYKGKTAAILAHGLNMIYPNENKKLAEEIIASGGCIISEYFPYETPKQYSFIERDRIQSGLSKGIIVIETEETGGTMHTVRFARKQKKKIGCMKYSNVFNKYPALKGNEIILNHMESVPIKNYKDIDAFIKK